MEKEKSDLIVDFLAHAVKAENDPIGRVGGIQARIVLENRRNRNTDVLGINLLGIYYAFPESYLSSISKVYGISKQGVQQKIVNTLIDIWNTCPNDIKTEYPLWKMIMGRSNKLRGDIRKVSTLIDEGKTVGEIRAATGLAGSRLATIRVNLRRRGIELDYSRKKGKILGDKIRKSESDEETQNLLNSIDKNMHTCFQRGHIDAITYLSEVIINSGFYPSNRETVIFAQALQNSGIPMGKVEDIIKAGKQGGNIHRYYIIATKDKERAAQVFLQDEKLDRYRRNPVIEICGPIRTNVPRVGQLLNKNQFGHPGIILEKLGIYFAFNSRFKKDDFFTQDCPVAIFRYGKAFYYDLKDENALKDFLYMRLQELRSSSMLK